MDHTNVERQVVGPNGNVFKTSGKRWTSKIAKEAKELVATAVEETPNVALKGESKDILLSLGHGLERKLESRSK